ncbi:MAG: DUF3226 domain-containing protein [Planctomycetota bacterium]
MLPKRISGAYLLLVEGKDEEAVSTRLLEFLGLSPDHVQIFDVGGKDKFHGNLVALPVVPGFDRLSRIAIIRDAESSFQQVFQSVADTVIKVFNQTLSATGSFTQGVPAIGLFITPGGGRSGMLEDLCIESVRHKEEFKCVESFVECVRSNPPPNVMSPASGPVNQQKTFNSSKARASAYLASQAYLTGLWETHGSVGQAAKQGHWDFSHAAFSELTAFLTAAFPPLPPPAGSSPSPGET